MGGADVAAGEEILNRAGIPTFPYPDTAARAFNYMWRTATTCRACTRRRPCRRTRRDWTPDRKLVEEHRQRAARRRPHDPHRVRIEAAAGRLRHPDGRDRIAADAGRGRRRRPTRSAIPVVLKLYSETITHKTDVGGVQLNLGRRRRGARSAFDAIETSVTREGRRASTSRASPCSRWSS